MLVLSDGFSVTHWDIAGCTDQVRQIQCSLRPFNEQDAEQDGIQARRLDYTDLSNLMVLSEVVPSLAVTCQ